MFSCFNLMFGVDDVVDGTEWLRPKELNMLVRSQLLSCSIKDYQPIEIVWSVVAAKPN